MTDKASHSVSRLLRNHFFAGLVVLVPIVLTVKALTLLFTFVDGLAQPLAEAVLGRTVAGIGFVVTIGTIFLAGLLFSFGPLKSLLDSMDALLDAVPLVGTVYGTTKKVLSGIGGPGAQNAFQRFVLARLPGRIMPGFLTGQFALSAKDGTSRELCAVYIPTNHLYVGDVVLLAVEDVLETDLTVEDGVSLVLSAGASVPRLVRQQ